MKLMLVTMMLFIAARAMSGENIIHDDGIGAQISFHLPVQQESDGQLIEFTTFRIKVVKDGKFLLFTDLSGKTIDGTTFSGSIIIPSEFVSSAEILMLGTPINSSRGISKTIKVSSFDKVQREKSWTNQK